jgi:hypothetical protein
MRRAGCANTSLGAEKRWALTGAHGEHGSSRGVTRFRAPGDGLAFLKPLDKTSGMRLWTSVALALCALSCNDELVEDVPPEECITGHRWVGGKRGSDEMFPGEDCVGCHLENDGPELMAGGTIYPSRLGDAETAFGRPQADHCFGVEGVRVVITGFDGEVFERFTNRAGNFYIEGRASELAKPYKVELFYTEEDGDPAQPSMFTQPYYGGCGNCHRSRPLPPTPPGETACVPGEADPTCPSYAAFFPTLNQTPQEVVDSGGRL